MLWRERKKCVANTPRKSSSSVGIKVRCRDGNKKSSKAVSSGIALMVMYVCPDTFSELKLTRAKAMKTTAVVAAMVMVMLNTVGCHVRRCTILSKSMLYAV